MNKKTTQSTAKVLLFIVCMLCSVLAHTDDASSNLTTDTFIREFFARHTEDSIKMNELNQFISQTESKLNQENYYCLFTKIKKIKAFVESINDNDDSGMCSVYFEFLKKCLTSHSYNNDSINNNNNNNDATLKARVQETTDSRESKCISFSS